METTDINRLTDYVNKGNELWETGKTMNNNTIIKFSLYIKTKATSFLDKIAKGEEINNLDSYFSQFDQYITQIEELIKETNQEQPEEDPLFPPMEETTRPTMPTTPTNNTTGNNTPSLQAMSE
jgi:hypothetical protein